MLSIKPVEWAIAHYRCELSQERLRSTPAKDVELALSRDPRGSVQMMSAVYVIGNAANNLMKIGYADNLKSRISGLSCGSPVELRLAHFVYFVDGFVCKTVETEAHKLLADRRRKGEWFEVTAEEAGEAIASSANARKFRWFSEEERRHLADFIRKSCAKYEERRRFFGT